MKNWAVPISGGLSITGYSSDIAFLDINMRGIGGLGLAERLLTIKCFGNFEVLHNGEILPFKRKKSKELLVVLIDRNGAGMTAKQIW